MDIIHFPDDARPARWKQPVLALGNFDGLHRGHRKILDRLQRVAGERRATSVVMTFDPHPPRVVRPDKAPPLLMTKAQKLEGLAQAGVDGAAIVRFTHELSQWEPETFVRTVLVEWLRVSEVWVGANFLFGHDRSGNFSLLRTLGARYGFKAEKIDPVRYKDFVVSSTRVRRLVSEARVDEAAALLGHPYVVDGVVVRGDASAAGPSDFRRRTCAARTSCCRRTASTRRTPSSTAIVLAVGHQHRHAADRRLVRTDVRRDAHVRPRSGSLRGDDARSPSSSGCATSGRSSRWIC